MTPEQYEAAKRLARSYASVEPAPDSIYGKRLMELMTLIEEYEREHAWPTGLLMRARRMMDAAEQQKAEQ